MEPPTPLDQENILIKEDKPKSQNSFSILSDKKNSFAIIFKNFIQFISIKTYKGNEVNFKEYEKIMYLNELKSNKYFSIFDSIDEIYEQIILEFNNKNEKRIIEEDNKIDIIIPINNIKIKEIKFTLTEKIKSNKDLIQDLRKELYKVKNEYKDKFDKLENENKNLKDEIYKLNNKVNELYNIISEIKTNNNNKYINEIQNKLKYNDSQEELINKSSIINNDINRINQIINWIKQKVNKASIKFELIFKMSQNGYSGSDFHKYCDNKGPTLVLIQTNKNNNFGGFTPLNWKNKSYPIDDLNQTFVFSNKKFDMINKNNYAIRCYSNEGPVFGDCDIKLGDDMRKVESYATKTSRYFLPNNLGLTGEKGEYQSFVAKEIEVFKVIY